MKEKKKRSRDEGEVHSNVSVEHPACRHRAAASDPLEDSRDPLEDSRDPLEDSRDPLEDSWVSFLDSLSPVMNSLKLTSPSLLWSRSLKRRADSVEVWPPQTQGASEVNSWVNWTGSMRYCSRYGRLGSWRWTAELLDPQ
ncbi:hypothetical protein EYF80_056439 [Liparis tanakae]|uniref:Uncharacterized protein n=1 Tax=Liparis tanakae TaxID=230148 RepID=A0A4Z2EX12_9TELE|nr:hypothetical protein EYF80_056439 [Liparis tanakae]